jgi:hypothetical protein
MRGARKSDRLKVSLGAASLALLANVATLQPAIAATLHVSWASGKEADLSGYRLKYGTSPGQYSDTIEVGSSNSFDLDGLAVDQRYFLVVTALDWAGNESVPSAEVSARLPASLALSPSLDAVLELSTHSIYALQGRDTIFVLYGTNFATGADVDLGPGIDHGHVTRTAQGNLQFLATTDAQAPTGPRTVTVANPDGGIGSRSDAVTVVKSPDINGDCHVDVIDLNALARAWNEEGGESRYTAAADFDGDGYVGPEDLAIFVQYYLRVFPGCP